MTVLQWALLGVGFAGCLGMSAFLSGMEAGLTEVSRLRLRRQAREGNKKAIRLQRYLDQPEDTLWTILVGNTLANLLVLVAAQNGFPKIPQSFVFIFNVGFWNG